MALYGDRFMVIVDTTVWVDYLREVENPETAWLDRELTRQRLGLTEQILSEVLLAIRDGGEFERVRDELVKFAVLDAGGCGVAVAENYRARIALDPGQSGLSRPGAVLSWARQLQARRDGAEQGEN